MKLRIKKFGTGSGREVLDDELPDDILFYLNDRPGPAISYLGKFKIDKVNTINKIVQTDSFSGECGMFMTTQDQLVKHRIVKKNSWIPNNSLRVVFYNEAGQDRVHLYLIHTDYE